MPERQTLKKTIYIYLCRTGDAKVSFERLPSFDNNTDWIELKHNISVPIDVFKKPKFEVDVGIAEKEERKSYLAIPKSTSLGMAELRAPIIKEEE